MPSKPALAAPPEGPAGLSYWASPLERIAMIKRGVRAAEAKRVFADLSIGQGAALKALNLSVATVNKKAKRDLDLGLCVSICHVEFMTAYRHVKLFKNGSNQAVRIPREFELPGEDAIMRREGDKLIIEAAPSKSLLALLARLGPIEDAFGEIEDRAPDAIEL